MKPAKSRAVEGASNGVVYSFGVIKLQGLYQPTRFEHQGGQVTRAIPTHEAVPYEATAYEYLSMDVIDHYAKALLAEAQKPQVAP